MIHQKLLATNGKVAHVSLKGKVSATRFVEGERRQVVAPLADLRAAPDGGLDCQLLHGANFLVLDRMPDSGTGDSYCFGQAEKDGYVGYVRADCLGAPVAVTHRVRALATHVYRAPDIKSGARYGLPFLAEVAATPATPGFFKVEDGYIPAQHLEAQGSCAPDFVGVLEGFLGIPYLWGGNSTWGMDCSGAVQLALFGAGIPCLRDADMQQAGLGCAIEDCQNFRRGDLVFWRGHVGVMADAHMLIHANATHMVVTREPLQTVRDRCIAAGDGPVTAIRRISEAHPVE